MPFYSVTSPDAVRLPLGPDDPRRLTVLTDRNQANCTVTLHSGENRVLELVSAAGLVVDDVELDPEIIEVRITPTAGTVPIYATLHDRR